jgi:hypothetical protein
MMGSGRALCRIRGQTSLQEPGQPPLVVMNIVVKSLAPLLLPLLPLVTRRAARLDVGYSTSTVRVPQ